MYNDNMRKNGGKDVANGFTIIEVMLVLAITGFLFIGLMGGMTSSLARQRYKDAVQDNADNLRRLYSYVVDVQVYSRDNDSACYGLTPSSIEEASLITNKKNTGRGRSECVVYGVLATISHSHMEFTEIIGKDYGTVRKELEKDESVDIDTMHEIEVLKRTQANNIVARANSSGNCDSVGLVNLLESFDSRWETRLLDTDGNELEASILVFRSPRSGAVRTYIMDEVPKVGTEAVNYDDFSRETHACTEATSIMTTYGINHLIDGDRFTEKELDICVDSGDTGVYDGRLRMIKIAKGGHSSSAIALIDMDDEDANKCNH